MAHYSLLLGIATGIMFSLLLTGLLLREDTTQNQEVKIIKVEPSSNGAEEGDRQHVLYSVVLWDDTITAQAIRNTWARHVDSIRFYTQYKRNYAADRDYGLLRLLKSVCSRDIHNYQWYVMLQSSTYVRTEGLKWLLQSLPLHSPLWLGQEEVMADGQSLFQYYCTSDITIMNAAMFARVCLGAWQCSRDAKDGKEELEFNRCLHDVANSTCRQLKEIRHIISFNTDLSDAIILYPLVNEEHLYYLHKAFLIWEFNETLAQIIISKQSILHEDSLLNQKHGGRMINMTYLDSTSLDSVFRLPHYVNKGASHHFHVDIGDSVLHCVAQSDTVSCQVGMVLPSVLLSLHMDQYAPVAKVNVIVATTSLMLSFQQFMIDFENSFLSRHSSHRVSLTVVLFTEHLSAAGRNNMFSSSTLVELYQLKYPNADIRLVRTKEPLSWREVYHLGLLEYSTLDLLFFANTYMKFSLQFINNCISSTIDGQLVYFPSLFLPFKALDYQKSYLLNPYTSTLPTDQGMGTWLAPSPYTACVFTGDLVSVLEREKDCGIGTSLMNSILSQKSLSIFSSPEPGLVYLWRRWCNDESVVGDLKMPCDSQ